jgi:hypothetical protein
MPAANGIRDSGSGYTMFSQTSPRSVRRIRANRSRWPTQYIPARMKLITKATSDGRSSASASFSEWPG